MSDLLIQLNDSETAPETKDPILEDNFRLLFPERSFPNPLSVASISGTGYGLYSRTTEPTLSGTYKILVEQMPTVDSDGIWNQVWTEEDMSSTEKTAKDEEISTKERGLRDIYLVNADWSQLEDTGLSASKKAEWVTYRQSLRDLPTSSGWPHNITWPTKPS